MDLLKGQIKPIYRKYRSAAYGALYQAPDKCVKTAWKEQSGTVVEMTSSAVPFLFMYVSDNFTTQRKKSARKFGGCLPETEGEDANGWS